MLEARGLIKTFPGVQALAGVDFDLEAGEVHVLLGENGAGKSTLVKLLTGISQPDRGEVLLDGVPVTLRSPIEASRAGIAAIHQELSLVPYLDVATNIFLGRTPVKGPLRMLDGGRMYREAQGWLDSLQAGIDARATVNDLGVGKRQLVEIAKALSADARILFMDEPTSALTGDERAHLFRTIRNLTAKGLGIVYISHKLEEVHQIGHRVTVLRDGDKIATVAASTVNVDGLIRMMVGREIAQKYHKGQIACGDIVLEVRHLRRAGVLHDISFAVRRGEILGIAGLVGSGRTELAQCLFGVDPLDAGEILVDGKPVAIGSPRDAVAHGIALLTENRKKQGLFLGLSVLENITLPALNARQTAATLVRGGVVRPVAQRRLAEEYVGKLRVKTPSLAQAVGHLSGGNQQKAVLAKWLAVNPRIIIFDEPTRGIDVGAKTEIYLLMEALLRQGIAVIMISSELPEILALSDRILVLSKGRITGAFGYQEANQEQIMACAVQAA
jgi:ribose transport system ATP-binding protein